MENAEVTAQMAALCKALEDIKKSAWALKSFGLYTDARNALEDAPKVAKDFLAKMELLERAVAAPCECGCVPSSSERRALDALDNFKK